ncbi:MAG: hypothetical protein R6V59_03375 [Dehalococcoidia bacterium]
METTALLILLMIGLAILVFYVLPRMRIRRAINQVVAIFERNNALDASSARTIDELGLRPRSFLQGIGHVRDFKPYALQALRNAEVVRETEDGRFYLSQHRLAATNLIRR